MLQESLGDHDHINSVFEDLALSEDKVTDQGFIEGGSLGILNLLYLNYLKSQIRYKYFFYLFQVIRPLLYTSHDGGKVAGTNVCPGTGVIRKRKGHQYSQGF